MGVIDMLLPPLLLSFAHQIKTQKTWSYLHNGIYSKNVEKCWLQVLYNVLEKKILNEIQLLAQYSYLPINVIPQK